MRKNIILGTVSLLVTIGVIALLQLPLTRQKPNINLVVSPTVASAQLETGKKIAYGKTYVTVGPHTLTASFSGFATKKVTFTAKNNGIQTVTVILIPNSTEGYTWLKNHPDEASKREALGGSQFYSDSAQRIKNNPIIKLLPYIGPGNTYRIDYGDPPASTEHNKVSSNAVGIYITYYTSDGMQDALNWIKSQGYNPDLLYLLYNDKSAEYQPTNNPYTN